MPLMKRPLPKKSLMVLLAIGALTVTANAIVLVDPTLFSGADAIDPAGVEGVDGVNDASYGTGQGALEALPGFQAVHDFTGFTAGTNIISFTDPNLPDIQFTVSGSSTSNSNLENTSNPTFQSSAGSSLFIDNNVAGTPVTLTIDFGVWNGTTFDGSLNSVSAAGFVLLQNADAFTYTVEFLTNAGGVLATHSFSGDSDADAAGNHQDIFVGLDRGVNADIGRITITRTGSTFNSGFDDLGFAMVPEPSTAMLLIGGLGLVGILRRKHSC